MTTEKPFITVGGGGPDIPDGVYPLTLVEIKEPKTVTAKHGPKTGQDVDLIDWIFTIDEGPYEGTTLETATTTASGPKSKMYGYLTALLGGLAPAIGTTFERVQLHGRRVLGTVQKDPDNGWPRIVSLGAMPASMLQAGFAKTAGLPATPGTQPLRETVAVGATPAADDDLPF